MLTWVGSDRKVIYTEEVPNNIFHTKVLSLCAIFNVIKVKNTHRQHTPTHTYTQSPNLKMKPTTLFADISL